MREYIRFIEKVVVHQGTVGLPRRHKAISKPNVGAGRYYFHNHFEQRQGGCGLLGRLRCAPPPPGGGRAHQMAAWALREVFAGGGGLMNQLKKVVTVVGPTCFADDNSGFETSEKGTEAISKSNNLCLAASHSKVVFLNEVVCERSKSQAKWLGSSHSGYGHWSLIPGKKVKSARQERPVLAWRGCRLSLCVIVPAWGSNYKQRRV